MPTVFAYITSLQGLVECPADKGSYNFHLFVVASGFPVSTDGVQGPRG